jgi:glycosyltransferase involved in cell wall biosynthesis
MSDRSTIRVSYVIVTKNRAHHLARTLANVREFIEPIDELIIIDGASSDETHDVVSRNGDIVTTFVSEPDCGEGHAFNKALFQSRGRYIKPLTDDDYFYPDAMRRLVAAAEENPDCDAIQAGGECWIEVNGKLVFDQYFQLKDVAPTQRQIFTRHIGLGLLIRRNALIQIGGSSPCYLSVDGDIHCKLVEAGCRVRYLDINLFRWSVYEHSGVRDRVALQHSWLMFDLRLRNWREFFLVKPELAASALGLDQVPHGVGLQYAIHYSARLAFGRYGAVLESLPVVVKFISAVKRSLTRPRWARGRNPKVAVPGLPEKSPFTGMLRE